MHVYAWYVALCITADGEETIGCRFSVWFVVVSALIDVKKLSVEYGLSVVT